MPAVKEQRTSLSLRETELFHSLDSTERDKDKKDKEAKLKKAKIDVNKLLSKITDFKSIVEEIKPTAEASDNEVRDYMVKSQDGSRS